jgi:predicted DNA-binding transcriptional regulator YafY
MNRIDRLFGIVTLLQSKKYVSAEKISDTFQISVRTVYRDMKALYELGIPVSFEQPKGYYIMQGYFIPPVAFTSEEANALLLTESLVTAFTDKSIRKHYASALNKVKAGLRHSQKEKLDILNDNMGVQFPSCMQSDFEYLGTVQEAIISKQILEIGYKNLKEEISKRRVEPIGLIFYALSWHLIGWCHMRKDYRDFRVTRITSIQNLELEFTKKDHIQIGEYMKELPVEY